MNLNRKHLSLLLLLSVLLGLSGCASLGLQSKRIFQKEVQAAVRAEVTEDIKQASEYLAKSADVRADAKLVAVDLSGRVGLPSKVLMDGGSVSTALRAGAGRYGDDLSKLNRWLDKYEGEDIEGTGLSLWGTGGFLVVILVVGLCVLMPALIPLFLQLIQVVSGTSRAVYRQTSASMVHAINDFKRENPAAAGELKSLLSKRMDGNSKAMVKRIENGAGRSNRNKTIANSRIILRHKVQRESHHRTKSHPPIKGAHRPTSYPCRGPNY